MIPPGLIIAAPRSGGGKTVVTMALLRHLHRLGTSVVAAKVGPDYIDAAFHGAAAGRPCLSLDPWAMRPETLAGVTATLHEDSDLVIVEGVMGLFDGARDGTGSTADLAALSGWPVVLVVDGSGMGASAGALLSGFLGFRSDVDVAGVIFNRVGSDIHRQLLQAGADKAGVKVLGMVPVNNRLHLPHRHLGLIQAGEHNALDEFLDRAAHYVARHSAIDEVIALARPDRFDSSEEIPPPVPPLGQHIAIAQDEAFSFAYPAWFSAWSAEGAILSFFSPLGDEAPSEQADAIFLPGGYPELYGGRLAGAAQFLKGLCQAARRGAFIYGECGGYMALGEGLEEPNGQRHAMAGLLPVSFKFQTDRQVLGYRHVSLAEPCPLGAYETLFRAHEFHYAIAEGERGASSLFYTKPCGESSPPQATGCKRERVAGSFLHLIDRA
ncbi:MAG: cobyrinate a,c-diamide synthase [Parvularculales bacterium]